MASQDVQRPGMIVSVQPPGREQMTGPSGCISPTEPLGKSAEAEDTVTPCCLGDNLWIRAVLTNQS